jgi:serine/tyrosine/threonine adenylyltransferase
MLREYIMSEAMQGLGVPTTRSLAVVTTGEAVIRETLLPGAVLTRVAASHIRVGTFQYISRYGSADELQALADYTLQRHFNNVIAIEENPYHYLLKEVVSRQAELISKWQLTGFIHGVMNTDNMAVSGETIDYGPCAFMDTYDPDTVFSSIDMYGRYAYGNQPLIAEWNLTRFAGTLLPLLHKNDAQALKIAKDIVSGFKELYHLNWLSGMRRKLGIYNEETQDESLIEGLLNIMIKYHADYTNTFRALTFYMPEDTAMSDKDEFAQWYELWQARLNRQQESKISSHDLMKSSNPSVIPRNHRVEEALKAAVEREDYSVMVKLLNVIANPYSYSSEQTEYAALPASSACRYRTFCGT